MVRLPVRRASGRQVTGVRLYFKAQEIEVTVAVRDQVRGCFQCAHCMHLHQWESRTWRHLDSCQFKPVIRADVPVVLCPAHGSQTVAVPWAERCGRLTKVFQGLAIDVWRECWVSAACGLQIAYQYDAVNRLTNMVDGVGTTSYVFACGTRKHQAFRRKA